MFKKYKQLGTIAVVAAIIAGMGIPQNNLVYANSDDIPPVVNDVEKQEPTETTEKNLKEEETETQEDKKDLQDTSQEETGSVKNEDTVNAIYEADTMTVLDISKGDISISVFGATVNGVTVPDFDITKPIHIIGNGGQNKIYISGVTASILLDNVTINTDTVETHPMQITDNANVTLLLKGTNTLLSNGYRMTVLRVDDGSQLTIDSATSSGSEEGSLSAKSLGTTNGNGAGIGGAHQKKAGNITILGGTIDAKNSVGIGGYPASNITISGGNVTTQGTQNGAGIGGYSGGNCGTILINGGTVHTTGGSAGAGIGNGGSGSGGLVEITGNAKVTAIGGFEAAGIGLGQTGTEIDISISGKPTIEVEGDRADIGGGGQENMIGTINISGGTIHTAGLNTAIGVSASDTGVGCDVHIKNATISGINSEGYIIRADIVDIKDSTLSYEQAGPSGFQGSGDVTISNSIIKTLGGFYSSKGTLIFDNANITVGSDDSYSSITTATKDIIIRNNSNITINSKSSTVINSNANLTFENSKLNAEFNNEAVSSTAWTYGLKATGKLTFDNSSIAANFAQEKNRNLLSYSYDIDVKNSTIKSNGRILGKSGGVNIESGYLQLTNATPSIDSSSGDVVISGGYIDSYGGIGSTGTNKLIINAVDGKGDGNAIIFAKGYSFGGSQDVSKGMVFYNANSTSSLKLKGLVLGDVTLKHLIEDDGKQFTIPAEYELHIQDAYNASLTVPAGMKLVNDGVIMNEKTVTVNGEFVNSKDALIYNLNLTPDKGTAFGGEITGNGTLTNLGDVRNEIYVSDIKLDGTVWNKKDAVLSTITDTKELTSLEGENKVFAHQGDTALYFNDIFGRNVTSGWKYINTDLEYFTLTYDLNYDGAEILPSQITAQGLIKAPVNPKRNGYTFKGWYLKKGSATDAELGSPWDFENDSLQTTTTLYAKWDADTYKIKYHLNGGVNDTGNKNSYTADDEIVYKVPMRKGYSFKGWYDQASGGNKVTGIAKGSTGDTDVYARWEAIPYLIIYHLDGGVNNTDNKTTYTIEDELLFKAPTKEGYDFKGWYEQASEGEPTNGIIPGTTGNIDVYARWEKSSDAVTTFIVNFDFMGGSFRNNSNPKFEVSIFSDSSRLITVYPYDTFVTKDGYIFDGWFIDKEYSKKWDFKEDKVNYDMTLYAKWIKADTSVKPSDPQKPSTGTTRPVIDKNKDTIDSVKTGDTTNTELYLTIAAVSVMGIVILFQNKRRRSFKKK